MSPSIKVDPGNNYHGNNNNGNTLKILIIVVGVVIIVLLALIVGMMIAGKGDNSGQQDKNGVIETIKIQNEVESVPTVPTAGRGVWVNGNNILNGTFFYNGGKYPFKVRINFDAQSGKVINASYAAAGQNFVKLNGSVSISGDGAHVSISGTTGGYDTDIQLNSTPGSKYFDGYMYRGTHDGPVKMTLQ